MGVSEPAVPSHGSLRPLAAGAGLAALGIVLHQVLGTPLADQQVAHTGAVALIVATGLPPVPWPSVEAMRWVTAALALPALLFGGPGALAVFGVGPLLYLTALWTGLGDDWGSPAPPPAPPPVTAVRIGAGLAALIGGGAWASFAGLWALATLDHAAAAILAGWVAAPGLALAICGAAAVATIRRARYAVSPRSRRRDPGLRS